MSTTHRTDIQGLRALAVLLVVAYHAGVPNISGGFIGVDLFFVLSGFLIIGLLTSELGRNGKVNLSRFWARRARRLLPASIVVIAVTLLVSTKVLPFFERKAVASDAIWAALFGANWRFAQQETDYLAADRDPSPLLHFWSLGVEEQFYFVTPLIFVAAAVLMRLRSKFTGTKRRAAGVPRAMLSLVLVAIIAASLAYCIHMSTQSQPSAFFGTPARAWQLAAGGLLAVLLPALPAIGRWVGLALSLSGLALFGACAVLLSEGGQVLGQTYPSWLAVGPTMSGLLLLAGGSGAAHVVSSLLSIRPLTFVGDISYGLYLWHWPALVLGIAYLEDDRLDAKMFCVAVAFVAATITFLAIEDPIRKNRWLSVKAPPFVSVALGAAMVLAILPFANNVVNEKFKPEVVTVTPTPSPEKGALSVPANDTINGVTPALDKAPEDEGPLRADGCQVKNGVSEVPSADECSYGDPDGTREVVLMGDSVGGAVFPAVNEAAKKQGWQLTAWAKSGCTLAAITVEIEFGAGTPWTECRTWRDEVVKKTIERKPDLVIMANSSGSMARVIGKDNKGLRGEDADRTIEAGLTTTIEQFRSADLRVALVESPHRAPEEIPECLIEKQSVKACSYEAKAENRHTQAMASKFDDLLYLRTNSVVCPDNICLPIVDRQVVYRDKIHFTTVFARTLTGIFERALELST